MANTTDPGMPLTDSIPAVTNDPDPLLIAIYGIGFLVAIVWNLYAYYKLFRLDHVKREMALKPGVPIARPLKGGRGDSQGLHRQSKWDESLRDSTQAAR